MIDFKALAAPFHPDRVSWRVGSTTKDKSKGMALAYLDARDVMERLDKVCSPQNWQCRYPHAGVKTVCEIGINVTGESAITEQCWTWKADGAGDSDIEAEKGALSDAFKRAAVRWGIGRYLYDLPAPWVALEPRGSTHVIQEGEYARLRKMLTDFNARWEGQQSPMASMEAGFREAKAEAWAEWATGDGARQFYRAAKNELQSLVNKNDLDRWMSSKSKEVNALYDHNRTAHVELMKLVNDRRDSFKAVAA